jgi:hypothetical protein
VRETNFRYNRQIQWVIDYRFEDRYGRPWEGRSGYLDPDEAAEWKPGDTGVVRFDPRDGTKSIWVGRA